MVLIEESAFSVFCSNSLVHLHFFTSLSCYYYQLLALPKNEKSKKGVVQDMKPT